MKESTEAAIRRIVREELSEYDAANASDVADRELDDDDRLAERVMIAGDLQAVEQQGLSPAEAIRQRTGVDPADYDDETELHAAVSAARSEQRTEKGHN